MTSNTSRIHRRIRVGAALVAVGLMMAAASPARAVDLVKNRVCRRSLGGRALGVVATGLASQFRCHILADVAKLPSSVCADTDNLFFEIFDVGRFDGVKALADKILQTNTTPPPLCDPILAHETVDNYDDDSIAGSMFPKIDDVLAFNDAVTNGTANVGGDLTKKICRKIVGSMRALVINKTLAFSNACMARVDAAASPTFGPLTTSGTNNCLKLDSGHCSVTTATKCGIDADCPIGQTCLLSPLQITIGVANGLINKNCTMKGVTGTDIGSCTPLDTCVSEAARVAALNIAQDMFPSEDCRGGSHCSTAVTKLCTVNADCPGIETCVPGPAAAARTLTVALNSGVPLGGADVRVDYPKFQSSIPKNGQEAAVQSAVSSPGSTLANDHDGSLDVSVAFATPLTSGTAFTASFDKCAPLEKGKCSVTAAGPDCRIASQCSARCQSFAETGVSTAALPYGQGSTPFTGTNTYCQANSDCTPGTTCLCPTCAAKHCVGPNSNTSLNTVCKTNLDCGTPIGQQHCSQPLITGTTCVTDAECIGGVAGTHCITVSTGPDAGNKKCSATCTVDADCSTQGAYGGAKCVSNICVVPRTKGCNSNADCTDKDNSVCEGDATGGGFCGGAEQCIPQAKVCSVSQWISCDTVAQGNPACPPGEQCVAQSSLTSCTVVDAFDADTSGPVNGVTCTVNATEP